jgi:hypothetical protein
MEIHQPQQDVKLPLKGLLAQQEKQHVNVQMEQLPQNVHMPKLGV